MKVILTKDVKDLGAKGDIVDVADGYARNYLVPKSFAVVATDGALRQAEGMRRARTRRGPDADEAQGGASDAPTHPHGACCLGFAQKWCMLSGLAVSQLRKINNLHEAPFWHSFCKRLEHAIVLRSRFT